MAYLGTTASSSVANPPICVNPGIGGSHRIASTGCPMGNRLWMYGSTEANSSSPFTANFFTDAKNLGMKQGDVVICINMATTVASSQVLSMGAVGAVTTDGTQLSTHSFISST